MLQIYVYIYIVLVCSCTMGLQGEHEVGLMIRWQRPSCPRRKTAPEAGIAVGFLRQMINPNHETNSTNTTCICMCIYIYTYIHIYTIYIIYIILYYTRVYYII